jgi:hypothetical protein
MLPPDLNFEVSEQSELESLDHELASTRSGLSQQLGKYSLADELDSQSNIQQITPDTTIQTQSNNPKRKKK